MTVTIGIIGDFDPGRVSHTATNQALHHSARRLGTDLDVRWVPTPALLGHDGLKALEACDGIIASPGSPYASLEGALRGIQLAREEGHPFLGT